MAQLSVPLMIILKKLLRLKRVGIVVMGGMLDMAEKVVTGVVVDGGRHVGCECCGGGIVFFYAHVNKFWWS